MKKARAVILALYMVLGSWKGYLALFEKGAEEPRQIYPYPIEALPSADQHALAAGIPIHSDRQLQQFLEDYLS